MSDGYQLRIFISYSGKGRTLWEPLVRLIEKTYRCEIIWGQDVTEKYRNPTAMMEDMVRRSDIAIFLLTNESDGVFEEMRLWYKHNSNSMSNALVLKDHSVDPQLVKKEVGFEPIYTPLSAVDPWRDIHFAFPPIHSIIMKGLLTMKVPEWKRSYNKIVRKYYWKLHGSDGALTSIERTLDLIAAESRYEKPDAWKFRINWYVDSSEMDSYSNKVSCLDLVESILHTNATKYEVESIFRGIDRVVKSNSEPPRKLSGNILFSGTSISTLREIQELIGNHPYENRESFKLRRAAYSNLVPDESAALMLPKELLTFSDNYERYVGSQRLILSVVSKICKYVLCSTVEITASHSMRLNVPTKEKMRSVLVMACTATRTNKESLAALSEIPIVTEENNAVIWYGQPYNKPTSEYVPHWLYHKSIAEGTSGKNLIFHFHPIELVDIYRKIYGGVLASMSEDDFIEETSVLFRGMNIDFHVFLEYRKLSARDKEFGHFMTDRVKNQKCEYSVVWKPNHGLWVFVNENKENKLVDIILELDQACEKIAQSMRTR